MGVVAVWFGPGAGVENTKSFFRGDQQAAAIAEGVEAVEAIEFRVIEDFEGFGVEGQQAAVVGGDQAWGGSGGFGWWGLGLLFRRHFCASGVAFTCGIAVVGFCGAGGQGQTGGCEGRQEADGGARWARGQGHEVFSLSDINVQLERENRALSPRIENRFQYGGGGRRVSERSQ